MPGLQKWTHHYRKEKMQIDSLIMISSSNVFYCDHRPNGHTTGEMATLVSVTHVVDLHYDKKINKTNLQYISFAYSLSDS